MHVAIPFGARNAPSGRTGGPRLRGRAGVASVFSLAAAVSLSGLGTLAAAEVGAPAATAGIAGRVPAWPTTVPGLPTFLQVPATRSTNAMRRILKRRISRRIGARALGRNVTIRVEDLETGARDFGSRSGVGMTPASTMKTATALAALSALGAEYRFPTEVRVSEDVAKLTLIGGGDPLLDSWNIDQLAKRTADRLIAEGPPTEKIQVLFDDSVFEPPALAPGWYPSYLSQYVTAPWGLTRDLRRTSDGARDAARYYRAKLVANGLKGLVKKKVHRGSASEDSRRITGFKGHTVSEAVWPMLNYSNNSIAENLIRHVAIARGLPTTPAGSAKSVLAELRSLGVPLRGAVIVDGSGLSAVNRLSTRTLVGIVRASMDPEDLDLSVGYRSLAMPIAGESGTLSWRFQAKKTKCAIGRIMAKTGTLTGVNALSGVASGDDGRPRAFSIVVNNRPSKISMTRTLYRLDRLATAVTGCR